MTTSTSAPLMGFREWALLLILSLLWGCSFFYFKVLVAELPPFTIVFGRVAIAALVLISWLAARRQAMPATAGLWASFAIMGLLNCRISSVGDHPVSSVEDHLIS